MPDKGGYRRSTSSAPSWARLPCWAQPLAIAQTTLTIATVNNGDMIRMQELTDDFTGQESRHHSSNG